MPHWELPGAGSIQPPQNCGDPVPDLLVRLLRQWSFQVRGGRAHPWNDLGLGFAAGGGFMPPGFSPVTHQVVSWRSFTGLRMGIVDWMGRF